MFTMPSFWLEHDDNGQTREFSFQNATVTIGREKASDFVLDHPTVSRKHAVITHKHGSFYLVVLSSSGLTALDGKPVQGEVLLYDSSTLHVGQLEFRFRSHEAPKKPGLPHQAGSAAVGSAATSNAGGIGANSGFGPNAGFGSNNDPGSTPGFGSSPNQPPGGNDSFGNQFGQGGASQPSAAGFGQPSGMQQPHQNAAPQGGAGLTGPTPQNMDYAGQLPPESAQPSPRNDAGIVSWDEIASSSEAMLDASGEKPQTIHERLQKNKEEKTNPALVGVAGIAILGLLYFTFLRGPEATVNVDTEQIPMTEQVPVVIEVTCLGASACLQKAKQAYQVGEEKLKQKNIAIANLFHGYKKMLEAEAYLVKAGSPKLPPKMAALPMKKQTARAELNKIWKNYQVRFHQAKKRSEYRNMVRELNALFEYFPDRTARENRWAAEQVQTMKENGVYPKRL
jgi:hypothetical protein